MARRAHSGLLGDRESRLLLGGVLVLYFAVILAIAGLSAGLPGFAAVKIDWPVIGVPRRRALFAQTLDEIASQTRLKRAIVYDGVCSFRHW